jgi:4-amino-4-deoxy-L-arabinose transferase-like glycosyltransferase
MGLAALLSLAAALRLVGIRYALPFPLLNPDERTIVGIGWTMVHGGGLDPGRFDYPSLLMELVAPLQAWHSAPWYLGGRIVAVVLGLGGVAAAWWLGRTAYDDVAGFVAGAATAVATTHVAYSRVAVTDVPMTLGITVALALAIGGRLELAGVAAGLAASFKYPGILVLVPLVVLAWGMWRRLAVTLGLAVVSFALTSPYAVLHAGRAWGDVREVSRLARRGWLGFENDPPALVAFAERLWDGLGPALLVGVAGLAAALLVRRRADVALATFALVWYAQLMPLHAHFDRYTLPLVPVLGALAGRLRSLVPVTLLLLVVPLTWSVRDAARLTRTDTRIAARSWIVAHVPHDAKLAADPSTADLPGYDVVPLALPGPGRPFDPERDVVRLRLEGVRFVVVTGAVEDRVAAARSDYPREVRFASELETEAMRVFRVEAGDGRSGPWVAVYRIAE